MSGAGVAVMWGLAGDRIVGEPPARWHPVVWFGTAMTRLEQRVYADSRTRGAAFCAAGVVGAAATGGLAVAVLGSRRATAVATSIAVAGRMLGREANAIGALLESGDLDAARRRLPSLVGRRPDGLDEAEIARAVIESVAENSVDAVIAPAVWALIGGAPAVLVHRAVNTLDAMVGHRSPRYRRFGWASARLDDVVNFVPARVAAVLVGVVRPASAAAVARVVMRDAGQHPSPNGGVIEAAFAAALGVRLGGVNRYGEVVENRGTLGDGPVPSAADVRRAVRLLDDITIALAVVGWVVGHAMGRDRAAR